MHVSRFLLVVVVSVLVPHIALALISEISLSSNTNQSVHAIQAVFRFSAQGKVEIELYDVHASREFIISIYQVAEYDELRKSNSTLCLMPSVVRLELGNYPAVGTTEFKYTFFIARRGQYVLVVLNCTSLESEPAQGFTETIKGLIKLTNPVSTFPLASQYSLEKQGFLAVYSGLTGIVLFLMFLWTRMLFVCKEKSSLTLQLVITAVFCIKTAEILIRFSSIILYAIHGVEQLSLMKVSRMAYEISELSILALLVLISSALSLRRPSWSTLRFLCLIWLLCLILGSMLSECQDFLGTSDSAEYILSITPMKIPSSGETPRTEVTKSSFLVEAIYEPICQVYTMIDFVVSSMTKLVIIVVLHLSIVRIKSEVDGTIWTTRKGFLFFELVRLLEFRIYYFYYLVLPIAVRVLKRFAIENNDYDWVEESMYQCGIVFFLTLVGLIFKPYEEVEFLQMRRLIASIKGDAALKDVLIRDLRPPSSRTSGAVGINSTLRDLSSRSNLMNNRELELS